MKIYDKASWHIDEGENDKEVVEKFSIIFSFLEKNGFLTLEGKEILDVGIDSSVSLHERLLTGEGNQFIDRHYDNLINLNSRELETKLKAL